MPEAGRPNPRNKSIDRMSSPERLHELMPLVSRQDWLTLLTVGVIVAGMTAWGIYGRVPLSVNGRGVFLRPRHRAQWQATTDGRIVSLDLKEGDSVRAGTVAGTVDQSEARKRLEQNRLLLDDLKGQDRVKTQLESQELALLRQRGTLERKSMGAQRENLAQTKAMLDRMAPLLADRLRSMRELQHDKLVATMAPEVIDAERTSLENNTRITETQSKLEQLATTEKDLEQQEEKLRQTQTEAASTRRNAIQQLSSQIAIDNVALQRSGQLTSQYTGTVVELVARPGQFVTAGSRLATVELAGSSGGLECVLYLPVRYGKRVQRGMEVQVTPDIVERERYGGITGKVISISPYPVSIEVATDRIGSSDLARTLTSDGPSIEVIVALDHDPHTRSSYRWSSSKGPPLEISAGTTNSARIVLEREPAVNYLMPFLRSLSGFR